MSRFSEYDAFDALGLADLIRRGEVSVEEVVETAIDRVTSLNPQLNAVVTPMFDEARASLNELDDGPFHGVPFLLKDLGADYNGVPTRRGSKAYQDCIPGRDAEIVVRYRRAGMVVIGKTNTPELGLNVSTEPAVCGPARNPWNTEHSTGGSSGGSAAAVAAGIVPAAHATDGGGSIRIPASCCGVFGLKPTRGRISAAPATGEGWGGMSTGHAVSRSVRDNAALLDATAGPAPGDPYWAQPPGSSFLSSLDQPPAKLHIAVCLAPPNDAEVHPTCTAAVREAAMLCQELGHTVEEARLPVDGGELRQSTGVIVRTKIAQVLDERAQQLGRDLTEEDLERATWWLYQRGKTVAGVQYSSAVDSIHRTGRRVALFMQSYDMILSPVLAEPPALLGRLDMMSDDPPQYFETLGRYAPFTSLANVTGQPAMSVPLFWSDDGLPIGVQFIGRYCDEARLLRLARQLEQLKPWGSVKLSS